MPGILSMNSPVVIVLGLWPSTLTTELLVLLWTGFLNKAHYMFMIEHLKNIA